MSTSPGVIEVHLRTAEQLFNSFDPSPFHERDLDDEAERYIVGWAREIKGKGQLQLIVTLPEAAHNTVIAQHIPDAIHNYFNYRALQARQELRELLRIGWRSLAIGIVVLLACFLAIQYMNTGFEPVHRRKIDGTEPPYPGLGCQLEALGNISSTTGGPSGGVSYCSGASLKCR